MGHREQAWTVGVSRDALCCVEAGLEQSGAHFEAWRLAGYGLHAGEERFTELLVLARYGGAAFLQDVPFEGNSFLFPLLQNGQQSCFFLFEILFWINSPVHREPASSGHHIEVRSAAGLAADQQNRVARLL